jgi:hypothetical protein
MTRVPPRRPAAVTADVKPEAGAGPAEAPPDPPARVRLSLGWRLCLLVWALGFFGLLLLELGGMAWKVGKAVLGKP